MYAFVEHLIAQSALWALVVVGLVAFFESLALVGLLLPGTVVMAALGALIGRGDLPFYWAWLAGGMGCLAGDWISFGLGRRFKRPLRRWSFLKKHKSLLDKTEYALHQHSMVTILIGRFVGPMRPLVPMMAGMLDLPPGRFAAANILGCISWPPVYFMPGILAGAAITVPGGLKGGHFQGLLLAVGFLIWLACWLNWRLWRSSRRPENVLSRFFTHARLVWLAPLGAVAALGVLLTALHHPLMPVYGRILRQVLMGG